MATKQPKLWVVEMFNASLRNSAPLWMPTAGAAISRKGALGVIALWRSANPDDQFRLRPYVREAGR